MQGNVIRANRILGIVLAVAVLFALVSTGLALVGRGQGEPSSTLGDHPERTPTASILGSATDFEEVLDGLRQTAPEAYTTIQAWLQEDISAAVASVRSELVDCSTATANPGALCEFLGVAPGTDVELFSPHSGLPGYRLTGHQLAELVQHMIGGRGPTPLFIAAGPDGHFRLALDVEGRAPFDWGSDETGERTPTTAIFLAVDPTGKVTEIADTSRPGSPPLETIRSLMRSGEPWTILAASAALRAWEEEFFATVEAQRRETPVR